MLALRSATPDQESTNAQLNAGENTLVAEVSNGIGGWGLYLRLSDARGADLALSKTGELKPFADKSADRIRAILRGGS